MTSLFIAVPAMGSVASGCVTSIVGAVRALEQRNIRTTLRVLDNSDIVSSRNALASSFMESDQTHLCFIDSDMSFKPHILQRMLDENRDIVACVCPRRSEGGGFAVDPGEGPHAVDRGIIEVRYIGMAVCIIKRAALVRLAPHVRQGRPAPDQGVKRVMFGFFDQITEGPDLFAEDFSFCRRWRSIGGTIQAIIDEDIGHIGQKTYRGQFLPRAPSRRLSLQLQAAKRPESQD